MSCGGSGSGGGIGSLFGQSQSGGADVMEGLKQMMGQSGGSRRRRRGSKRRRSSGSRKTRRHGKRRACRCPGGCKRSTCPCHKGKKRCCTKRCRSRGCRC